MVNAHGYLTVASLDLTSFGFADDVVIDSITLTALDGTSTHAYSGESDLMGVGALTRRLEQEIGIDTEDKVSADHATAHLAGMVLLGYDEQLNPVYAGDGSVIEWRVEGPGGQLDDAASTVTDGFVTNVLHTSRHAGDQYRIFAKVTHLVIDGEEMDWDGAEIQSWDVHVVPGQAANIQITAGTPEVAGVDSIRTMLTLSAEDAYGNLVSNGSSVSWTVDGSSGSILFADGATQGGAATAFFDAVWASEGTDVQVRINDAVESITIPAIALNVTLSPSQSTLVAGSGAQSVITATFTTASGGPVPDGTAVEWFNQKGTIVAESVTSGGVAHATVTASGRANNPGVSFISARLGRHTAFTSITFSAPVNGMFLRLERPVLAGDKTTNGTVTVPNVVPNTTINQPYFGETIGHLTGGAPNGLVTLTLVGAVGTGGFALATINGYTGSTTVQLNASGEATFTLQSTGAMVDPSEMAAFWVNAQVAGSSQVAAQTAVTLQDSGVFGRMVTLSGHTIWGAIAGNGNDAAEVAGDISLSFVPVVGVYTDVRDLLKEAFKLVPGGEEPDTAMAGLAAFGILTEIAGPLDWLTDIARGLKKLADASIIKAGGALFRAVEAMAERYAKSKLTATAELLDHKDLLFKIVLDPDYAKRVDAFIQHESHLTKLNKASAILNPDVLADLIKAVPENRAGELLKAITNLAESDATGLQLLKSSGKVDVIARGFGTGTWAEYGRSLEKYVEAIRTKPAGLVSLFDEFAHLPGADSLLKNSMDSGVENVLTVAKRQANNGDLVQRFSRQLDGGGDIDLETTLYDIEVKGKIDADSASTLRAQLERLAQFPSGKLKAVAYRATQSIKKTTQKVLDDYTGVVEQIAY